MNPPHSSIAQPQWILLIYNPLTGCNKWRVETRNATAGVAPDLPPLIILPEEALKTAWHGVP